MKESLSDPTLLAFPLKALIMGSVMSQVHLSEKTEKTNEFYHYGPTTSIYMSNVIFKKLGIIQSFLKGWRKKYTIIPVFFDDVILYHWYYNTTLFDPKRRKIK